MRLITFLLLIFGGSLLQASGKPASPAHAISSSVPVVASPGHSTSHTPLIGKGVIGKMYDGSNATSSKGGGLRGGDPDDNLYTCGKVMAGIVMVGACCLLCRNCNVTVAPNNNMNIGAPVQNFTQTVQQYYASHLSLPQPSMERDEPKRIKARLSKKKKTN